MAAYFIPVVVHDAHCSADGDRHITHRCHTRNPTYVGRFSSGAYALGALSLAHPRLLKR